MIQKLKALPFIQKVIAATAIQILIILVMTTVFGIISASGTKIFLRIEPVDPRDPLRGDYVTFQYQDLSQISHYSYSASDKFKLGETIYVQLEQRDGYWGYKYNGAKKAKPTSGIFIKGTVTNINAPQDTSTYTSDSYQRLYISYGIEEYFIPENSGRRLPGGKKAMAEVAVSLDGDTILKQLYVDGKKWP